MWASNHGSAPWLPDVAAPDAGEHKTDRKVLAVLAVFRRSFNANWLDLVPAFGAFGSPYEKLISALFEGRFTRLDSLADDVANGGIFMLPIPERHSRDAVFRAAVFDVRLASFVGICDVASNLDAFFGGSYVRIHASIITEKRGRVKDASKRNLAAPIIDGRCFII